MTKRRPPPRDAEPPSLEAGSRASAPPAMATPDDDSLPKIARTQRPRKKSPAAAVQPPPTLAPNTTTHEPKAPRKRRPPPPMPQPIHDGRMWGLARIGMFVMLGVFALSAVMAGAMYAFMPTDMIRDRLVAEVKSRTGRDLAISGATSLSLWPRIAITLGGVRLSNTAAFGTGALVTADSVEAAVQIRPLLSGDVQVEQLTLRRPVIELLVDKDGRRNWDFAALDMPPWPAGRLAQMNGAAQSGTLPLPREVEDFVKGRKGGDKQARDSAIVLEAVSVVDGIIRYRDQSRGVAEEVRALNLTTRMTTATEPLDGQGNFVWRGEPVMIAGQIAPFQSLLYKQPGQVRLTVTAAPLTATVEGTLAFADGPDFEGRVKAQAGSAERLASWSGRPLPVLLPGALDFATRLKIKGPVTALADTTFSLDKLGATGALTVDTRGVRPFLQGSIKLAELDLNALQAIAGTAAPVVAPAAPMSAPQPAGSGPASIEDLLKSSAQPAQSAPAGRSPQVRGYARRKGWSDDPIRLDGLKSVDADLKLAFATLKFKDVVTGAGAVSVGLKDGAGRFTLDDLLLYDGRARGVVTLENGAGGAIVGTNLVAEGVSVLPFLKSLSGFDWLAGRARVAVAFAGQGQTERQIVSTLNGKAELTMGDGSIQGINVAQMLRGVMQGKLGNFDRVPSEKTDFSELAGSMQFTNGVGRNNDFRLQSPLIRATGAGSVNLPGETIDYVLKPKVVGTLQGQDGGINLTGVELPLKISGPLEKPVVKPELGGLLKDPNQAVQAVQEALKTPQGKELEATVKGALAGDEAAKAKAKALLNQFLKR